MCVQYNMKRRRDKRNGIDSVDDEIEKLSNKNPVVKTILWIIICIVIIFIAFVVASSTGFLGLVGELLR